MPRKTIKTHQWSHLSRLPLGVELEMLRFLSDEDVKNAAAASMIPNDPNMTQPFLDAAKGEALARLIK